MALTVAEETWIKKQKAITEKEQAIVGSDERVFWPIFCYMARI